MEPMKKKCTGSSHGASKSPHDFNYVPVNLFYKNGEDDSKGFFKTCLDCRLYLRIRETA